MARINVRSFVAVMALGCALASSPVPADPPVTVVDQMQPVIDTTIGAAFVGGNSDQILAQTVTAGIGGRLDGVMLPVVCESGQLVMEITTVDATGQPGTSVLATSRFPAVRVPDLGPVFQFLPVTGLLRLVAGDRFAIVLRNDRGSCFVFQGPVGDSYASGDAYFDARPNPPGWIAFSTFPALRHDLPFSTIMRLP